MFSLSSCLPPTVHIKTASHPTFLCPRARRNRGKGAPNWAIHEKKRARDERRAPSYEVQPPAQEATSTSAMDTSAAARESSTPTAAAAAAAAPPQATYSTSAASPTAMDASRRLTTPMSPPGPTPMAQSMGFSPMMAQEAYNYGSWLASATQTTHEEHVPEPGNFIPGNLWNLNFRTPLEQAGPISSFVRHTNSMANPNYPRHARTSSRTLRTQWLTSDTWSSSALKPTHCINGQE